MAVCHCCCRGMPLDVRRKVRVWKLRVSDLQTVAWSDRAPDNAVFGTDRQVEVVGDDVIGFGEAESVSSYNSRGAGYFNWSTWPQVSWRAIPSTGLGTITTFAVSGDGTVAWVFATGSEAWVVDLSDGSQTSLGSIAVIQTAGGVSGSTDCVVYFGTTLKRYDASVTQIASVTLNAATAVAAPTSYSPIGTGFVGTNNTDAKHRHYDQSLSLIAEVASGSTGTVRSSGENHFLTQSGSTYYLWRLSDMTNLWSSAIPGGYSAISSLRAGFAIDSSGNVFVIERNGGSSLARVRKLAASDGSESWSTSLGTSSGIGVNTGPGLVLYDETEDVVLMMDGKLDSGYGVMSCDGATGSVITSHRMGAVGGLSSRRGAIAGGYLYVSSAQGNPTVV